MTNFLIRHLTFSFATIVLLSTSNVLAQDGSSSAASNSYSDSRSSSVGVFLEPMLIGLSENISMKSAQLPFATSNTSGTTTGYGLGMRFGMHLSEFFLGVDGRYNREQMKDSFYQTADADVYSYGPTAGVQMPYSGLRLVGTYVMGGQFNAAPGINGLQLNFKDPTGWRAGLGFHIASLSLNLEYQDLTYNTTQVKALGSLALNSTVNMQTETNGYMLSLSFPNEF